MADDDFDLPPPPEDSTSSAPAAAAADPFAARAAAFRSGAPLAVAAVSVTPAPAAASKAGIGSSFKPVVFGGAKPPGSPGATGPPGGFQPAKLAGGPPGSTGASPVVAKVQPVAAVTPIPVATTPVAAAGRTAIDVSTIVVTYRDDQRWALGLPCTDLPEFREKQLIEEKAKKETEKKEKEGKDREAKEREEREKKNRAEMKQEEQRQQKLAKEQKEREEREAAERAKKAQAEAIAASIAKAKEDKKRKEEEDMSPPPPPDDDGAPPPAEDPFASRANAFRSAAATPAAGFRAAGATPPGFKPPGGGAAVSPTATSAKPGATGPPGPPGLGGAGAGANSQAIAQAAAARAAAAATLRKANEEAAVSSPPPAAATGGGHASPYTRGVTSAYRRQVPVAVEIAQPVKNSRYTKPTAAASQEDLAREQKVQLSQQQDAERKRYDDFKKSFVPKPKREFPMPQRQQLLNIIQGCSILASIDGGSGGMQVSVDDLDRVLSEAGSLAGAETYLSHMQNTGKRCHGFEALVEGVAEAREQLAAERTKLGKYLGVAWKENIVTELFEGCCAAGNTLSYVRQFCPLPHKPENVSSMIATIKAAITAQKEKGKQDLIKYLSSNECSLFTGPVALKQSDLRRLIATGGGYAPLILANLKCLDALGERFAAFTELEAAMTNKKLVEFKQELLTSLFRLRTALFKSSLKVPINAEAVNTLLADGQGALSTLEILELVASGAEEPFQTMNEVAENVRTFADLRTEAVVREIDAVFSFMERNGLFSVAMSATSGDVKKVVVAIFDAHYGITGGDCTSVLKHFTDRRQAFTSFPELIAAIKSRALETEAQNIQLVQQSAGGVLSWSAGR